MNSRPVLLRDRQKEQTRAEIVRVAFDLFGKHGYEEVPVEKIAEAAGVSRATFFNYFPQKDILLRYIAEARAERLKSILSEALSASDAPTMDNVLELLLKLTKENARISARSKKLLLETVFGQASRGLLLVAREHAIEVLTQSLKAVLGKKKKSRLLAETLFAVYLATMLEWLLRDGVPEHWLVDTMRDRLQLVVEGAS
ncbi:MAG: TetR family transcriptional regulator [Terracidiphilus sp.]|jgi:AcrR family transcriptional regulator